MSSKNDNILTSLISMPRFGPALFATFIAGILLLFLKDLGENIKLFLIPSLIVYSLGASFLGSFHRMLGFHYVTKEDRNNENPIPTCWKIAILSVHIIWFASFVLYNFYRQVL